MGRGLLKRPRRAWIEPWAMVDRKLIERHSMRNLFLGLAAAASLLGVAGASGGVQAEPSSQTPQLIFGVDRAGNQPMLDRVQFIFGGRNYCWYTSAWRGPGFYWCGYAWRRGLGWGGGQGWRGWRGGPMGYRGRVYHRGHYHGHYRGWHGHHHSHGHHRH
jgi:hypothetical protein